MSAREETPVGAAARGLLAAHGVDAEQAAEYVRLLGYAGMLVGPESAADILAACREQAAAEHAAEVADLRDQLTAARRTVAEQQEQIADARPPRRGPLTLAEAEAYSGELVSLRGLLGQLRVIARHGTVCELREALAEQAAEGGGGR